MENVIVGNVAQNSKQKILERKNSYINASLLNVLTLISALPTVTIQSSTYTGQYGNSVTLVCTVSAVPFQTNVYWEKDGFAQINSGDNGYSGSTTNNPSLTINSVTTSDQGTYRCFATNIVGTGQSSTTQLTVSGGNVDLQILPNF